MEKFDDYKDDDDDDDDDDGIDDEQYHNTFELLGRLNTISASYSGSPRM
jgi:hypothetical protein